MLKSTKGQVGIKGIKIYGKLLGNDVSKTRPQTRNA
jgi:hypothetical protein